LDTLSLPRIELMWNFTVCSDMPRRAAISLFPVPSASSSKTSSYPSVPPLA
jgi:hypothetical protein